MPGDIRCNFNKYGLTAEQINRDCSSEKNRQDRIDSTTAVQNRSTSLKFAEGDCLFPKQKGFQYLTVGYGVPI